MNGLWFRGRRRMLERLEDRRLLASDVVISELMASNEATLIDEDGGYSDWIELYNRGDETADLTGWHLTDDADQPGRWRFPQTSLEAGAFLVVFASGKNRSVADGEYHTNFKLSRNGEYLALFEADGTSLVQEFAPEFPSQSNDVSYGLTGTQTELQYFVTPTPGAPNEDGVLGTVSAPSMSVDRGFFYAPFELHMESTTEGATIRFTLDGSVPSASNGMDYQSPIHVTKTSTVRAVAYKDGYRSSPVATHTYLFLRDVIQQNAEPVGYPSTWGDYYIGPVGAPVPADYGLNQELVETYSETIIDDLLSIPSVSIVMEQDDLFDEAHGIYTNPFFDVEHRERPTSIEWITWDGDVWQEDAGIRLVGGWSRHFFSTPKKSFTLKFTREYGNTKLDYPLFAENQADSLVDPTSSFDTVLLRAVFSDAWPDAASPPQYLRDLHARYAQLAMGQPSSHGSWIHLYLNGLYWGIYNVSERPDASFAASYADDLNAEKEDFDGVKHAGLCNPGCARNDAFEVIDGGEAAELGYEAVLDLASAGLKDNDRYREFKELVDVENLADYVLLEHYLGNIDWPHKNWYANRQREGGQGWQFYVWDSEYTLRAVTDTRINASNPRTPAFLWNAARQNEEFRSLFADRVHKHLFNDGVLRPEVNIARYQALAEVIDGAIKLEAARWGDNGATRKGNTNYDYEDWKTTKHDVLTNFFPRRHEIAIQQLRDNELYPDFDAPRFSQFGGVIEPGTPLEMSTEVGTIHYTVDGTDPRGVISPEIVSSTVVVSDRDDVRVWVPTDGSLDEVWRSHEFDDSDWLQGTFGVGLERRNGYEEFLGTDLLSPGIDAKHRIGSLSERDHKNSSVYMRSTFHIEDPTAFDHLGLRMRYDDGFVVYLNGVEVARANSPDNPVWNSKSVASHRDSLATELETFVVNHHVGQLQPGENVLAIHGLNYNLRSNDMLIAPEVVVGVTTNFGRPTTAKQYTSAIPLDETVHIKARVLDHGEWSALTEATFTTEDARAVRITELMFNPADGEETEFIELQNVGANVLNLDGMALTDGIDFGFGDVTVAPGEIFLLVRDLEGFQQRYDTEGLRILGEYMGSALDNGGERVALEDRLGRVVWDLTYQDDWVPIADGFGFSLTRREDQVAIGQDDGGRQWRASSIPGGTPGRVDVRTLPVPGDLIMNEVFVGQKVGESFIEIHNVTSDSIDIGNWLFSDDAYKPLKVQLPREIIVPAEGYVVLTEGQHFGKAISEAGFQLSDRGGEISLTAGDESGNLVGFQLDFELAPMEAGVAVGRHVDEEGKIEFLPLRNPTPGRENGTPLVGPIVISELMYWPRRGDHEYIELENISDTAVVLSDEDRSWSITDAVEFDFPLNAVIPARGRALVVPLDPDVFRDVYQISSDVPVYGPYFGSLDNQGETVRLQSSADVRVDVVGYDTTAPWPTSPKGLGPSLERTDARGYGNTASAWIRGSFGGSPGAFNAGIDRTAPSLPAQVRVTQGARSERIHWEAAIDRESQVTAYRIYRDGIHIGTTSAGERSFSLPAAASPVVHYEVTAVNGDGIEGLPSQPTWVTELQNQVSPDSNYQGTVDVQLSESNPTDNLASATTVLVSNDFPEGTGQHSIALLRWDVGSISDVVTLDSVAIEFNMMSSTSQTYHVYEMRRDWQTDAVNWLEYAPGQLWQVAGAAGADDRGADVLGTIGPAGFGSRRLTLNDTGRDVVQDWLRDARPNYGFALVPASEVPGPEGGEDLDGLIAFYSFDELVDGQALDVAPNGPHATIEGTVSLSEGFDGGAFRFDGAGHVVAPIDINPSALPKLTMGAWVKMDDLLAGLYKIIGHDNGGWDRTLGLDHREGPFRWTSFVGFRRPVTPTAEPIPHQWSFVAAAYDEEAEQVTVYIDIDANTLDDELQVFSEPTNFNRGQTKVSIGSLRPDNFSEGFRGWMDNVFFFGDTLDVSQITRLRDSGAAYFREGGLTFDSTEAPAVAATPRLALVYRTMEIEGDVTRDGRVDVRDVDRLFQQLGRDEYDLSYDLNVDGLLDQKDRDRLVKGVLGTTYGDTDLNGVFDIEDLTRVFQIGEYEDQETGNSSWGDGDWDGDGDFTSEDIVLAFTSGRFVPGG